MDQLELFNEHRPLLFSTAYRMLGSVMDAEDMVQETFLRWQQAPDADVESPKAYLTTIITRLCINHMNSARVQREQYVGPWLPEPIITDQGFDPVKGTNMAESLSMAFLVLLEQLTPVERAVFLLREVFDYEYSEIARILDQKETNCRQILRRARQHLKQSRPRFDFSPEQHEELLQQFLQATSRGDIEGLLALFSKEIVLYSDGGGKAAAMPNPIHGPDRVARFLFGARKKLVPKNLVSRMVQINGHPGIVSYLNGHPWSVLTLDITDGRIRNIYIVTNPEKLERLPTLPC
jgi:RNA polymerase sigma-70 factor (ECF subfamily)